MKMLEGLWSVEFPPIPKRPQAKGAGVAVFLETKRILGGDNNYHYGGSYEVKNGVVEGEVEVRFYGRKASSIFRSLTKFRVKFSGKARPRIMRLKGFIVEDPERKFDILLGKRAELQGNLPTQNSQVEPNPEATAVQGDEPGAVSK
jgi:hypothetical protein